MGRAFFGNKEGCRGGGSLEWKNKSGALKTIEGAATSTGGGQRRGGKKVLRSAKRKNNACKEGTCTQRLTLREGSIF